MPSPYLLSLPTEILTPIADDLKVEDYGALRLSSKQVEANLFPHFGRKFFTRRRFYRDLYSLSVLRQLSESRLRSYVKTIVLGTELLPNRLPTFRARASATERYKLLADHRAFLASGLDGDLLANAFQELPNLEAVVLHDLDGRPRPLEHLVHAEYALGYGLKSLLAKLGVESREALVKSDPWTDISEVCWVQSLLTATAKAKKAIKSFKVIWDGPDVHSMSCDNLHIPSFHERMILPILAGLEDLHLDVESGLRMPDRLSRFESSDTSFPCPTFSLREFLGYTTHIQRLWLGKLLQHGKRECFWNWLAAKPGETQYKELVGASNLLTPPPVAFAHLKELGLGMIIIPIGCLLGLLEKISATLTKLSLLDVIISSDVFYVNNLEDLFEEMQSGKWKTSKLESTNLWADLFNALSQTCHSLYEVAFTGRLHQIHGRRWEQVRVLDFSLRNYGNCRYSHEFSYRGPDIRDVLYGVAKETSEQKGFLLLENRDWATDDDLEDLGTDFEDGFLGDGFLGDFEDSTSKPQAYLSTPVEVNDR